MKKRQYIISAIVTLFILVLAWVVYINFVSKKKSTVSDEAPREELVNVIAHKFVPSTVQSKIEIDGRVNAYEQIDIASEVSGRLQPISKQWKNGGFFKKGELLFQVESEDTRYDLYGQRSNLMNAITQIMPDLKYDYPQAFNKWQNYLDQFDVEKTTKPLPAISNKQEKYFIAGKNIYSQYYAIKSTEERLKKYNIYAPFTGVFLSLNAYPGSVVNPGSPLGRVMNTNKYELSTPINSKDYGLIKRGQKVTLYSDELGTTYTGVISRISSQIDQSTQSIPVYITVSGKQLRDGMYLKGTLIGNELNDAVTLPNSAIVNQNEIYSVEDGFIRKKQVDIILRSDTEVHVRGITSDDAIITEGSNSLSPGQRVNIVKS